MNAYRFTLGAIPLGSDRCAFRVWAPEAQRVEVHLVTPTDRIIPLLKKEGGYHGAIVENVSPGSEYLYRLDGHAERPDPASRSQPGGVHGPSRIVEPRFEWTDAGWFGLPWREFILYELHVGTFSEAGTFDGVAARLPELKQLGITAIELMPVAQFPGARNWGYDGVYPFAVQDSYGGPKELKRLVNAAHQHGLAVVLDVVYSHLGPEGNYLHDFAPYFTDRYHTPWGPALNFDGPHSDNVRHYFVENALYWQTEFHFDALRLDAVHAIRDFSPIPFLEELAEACHRQAEALNRRFHIVAESDLNMARHILPRALGGYGLDAQWSDDFHHCLRVLLTGERGGYYADFSGVSQFAKVWREGYAYTGEYSSYRRHRHGSSPRRNPVKQFVVCCQNHDQVGNRVLGDRLSTAVSLECLKLAAGAVLLSPFIPLLFMGEEYGEEAPFQYFTSHGDPELAEAVRRGRRNEFVAFLPAKEAPDPQDPATFERSKLNRVLQSQGHHAMLHQYYRELIAFRRTLLPLVLAEKESMQVLEMPAEQTVCVHYRTDEEEVLVLLCFAARPVSVEWPLPTGKWTTKLNSADVRWSGPGRSIPGELTVTKRTKLTLPATSCLLFHQENNHQLL